LQTLIRQFRRGAEQIGLELMDSFTPIQPIMIGDAGRACACRRCCANAA
jgi:8-amino-7-oxononanoate synthase